MPDELRETPSPAPTGPALRRSPARRSDGADAGGAGAPARAGSRPPGLPADARKPRWLKVPLPGGEGYTKLKGLARSLNLHTVCEEARCPNVGECWSGPKPTMTLMVLGDECTRRCRFCAVKTVDRAAPPDPQEPDHVGHAVAEMAVGYVVITSVDRDDLPDGGAAHYAACVRSIRSHCEARLAAGTTDLTEPTVVETLIPDYRDEALATLVEARPDVLAHNVEVVDRLQRRIRDPRCSFERSLETLRQSKRLAPEVFTKSALMVGLGETEDEVLDSMRRLREAGVDFLTIGQYLRPTPNHAPVREWVTPERFASYQVAGERLGFRYVASNPLVRSSYKAGEFFFERMVRERRASAGSAPIDESHA